ncbi:hypothetical protein Pla22_33830 [Rubripirellula amarantea]|uniref:Outer membrane efflux protein n=1 Tax=Rubripirellula amarantea TaxID=2527999 RepID=A0A5C5WJ30_9BACT|nr:hypothetical protein [Rubripirellula amarantea]TWT50640.1 hypothetical protein Pla22_33830 [Rubripirellula amarantea]
MTRLFLATTFATLLIVTASSGVADTPASAEANLANRTAASAVLNGEDAKRLSNAELEYSARLAEFKDGRSPADVSIRANKRLLRAALMASSPNAISDYDQRASLIESIAEENLKLRTSTQRDVKQAKAARLSTLLLDALSPNAQ